jgi:hypothetical protein
VAGNILRITAQRINSDDVINEFINSVVTSKYKDIVEITYNYMNRLIYSGDNLLYEEFLKVLHLFDSINTLSFLGLNVSAEIIEKSDADMIFFQKKNMINGPENLFLNIFQVSNGGKGFFIKNNANKYR